ncbi:MAG: DegT/DnrJ/EryC1/StrS family aminotransferase [Magnetococcales bacterium]|nr:DegT/DnrJ/EryC1/StrS family aminotransferase [Magnetococcales bacterium]
MTTQHNAELIHRMGELVRAYCEHNHDFAFHPDRPVVRLHEPTFGADEIMAVVESLLSTQVTMGERVLAFERQFAHSLRMTHGVMNNSGSSANLLAIAALANRETDNCLRPGDEVIVPALSWSTTVWPLIQNGLVPVIVDIDPVTLNIDPEQIDRAVGPKTKAVMVVHVYGNPCDMTAIIQRCQRYGLQLIEDCCEALGAEFDGRAVGSMGRVGTFSFYFSHHITTMEGGICVTEDLGLAEMMRILRSHGWTRNLQHPERYTEKYPDIDPRFLFVNVGFNLRPTEPQAAMGAVQLPKLAGLVANRRRCAAQLQASLAPFNELFSCQQETVGGYHSWFGFPIVVNSTAPFSAAHLRRFLAQSGIETRPIICGNIAHQPGLQLYPHRLVGTLDCATHVMKNGLAIASHHAVDEGGVAYMVERIRAFLAQYSHSVTASSLP